MPLYMLLYKLCISFVYAQPDEISYFMALISSFSEFGEATISLV